MRNMLKFSLAFAVTAFLGNSAALTANAQEVTMSPEVVSACSEYGLNVGGCACFFAELADAGVLQDGDQVDFSGLLAAYSDDVSACAAANPGDSEGYAEEYLEESYEESYEEEYFEESYEESYEEEYFEESYEESYEEEYFEESYEESYEEEYLEESYEESYEEEYLEESYEESYEEEATEG